MMRRFIKYYKDVQIYYDDEIELTSGSPKWIIEASPNTRIILASPYIKDLREVEGYINDFLRRDK